MYEEQWVRGIVLSVSQLGEYDKRMVVLTEQLGRITVFANGARRQNNRFTAVAQSFTMGRFLLRPGKQAYTLTGAEIQRSFLDLTLDVESFASASYCSELTEYFTREGLGGKDELNLLYFDKRQVLAEDAQIRKAAPVAGKQNTVRTKHKPFFNLNFQKTFAVIDQL